MRHPEKARLNHLKEQLPPCVRKISTVVGPGPDIWLPPWSTAEEEGEKNQRWAASHRLLCAPENRVQQHQLPGIGHGAGQGGVRIVGGQRHQGGEHDTGRPHPPAGQLVCGMTGTKGQCRSKTSRKFMPEPASHSLVSDVTRSQSEAASGGSGSADVPPLRCPGQVLLTPGWRKRGGCSGRSTATSGGHRSVLHACDQGLSAEGSPKET